MDTVVLNRKVDEFFVLSAISFTNLEIFLVRKIVTQHSIVIKLKRKIFKYNLKMYKICCQLMRLGDGNLVTQVF